MVAVGASVPHGMRFAATPDLMPLAEAEALARALARFQPSDDATEVLAAAAAKARAGQEFMDLFHIEDARTWDPRSLWSYMTSSSPNRLRIPLGRNPTTGSVVWLDLKEGAEQGQGPHGMMVGQTGSGKSETLAAFVLAMAVLHPPEMLQMLLADLKGESAFSPFANLPHVQGGVVSNLADADQKLERLEDTLLGEVARRLRVCKDAGYPGNVRDYERARATTRPDLKPLGALVVVIDEFSELLRQRPGMADVCDVVGRQGRALWIHILNASQRPDVGKMQNLMAQQTYSIGLKVKDAGESRAAIGSNRAYEDLKGAPQGTGFLVHEGDHQKFRSFYVNAPYLPPRRTEGGAAQRSHGQVLDPHPFTAQVSPLPADVDLDDAEESEDDVLDEVATSIDSPRLATVIVDRIIEHGRGRPKMHRMYRPPLEELDPITADEMAAEYWGRGWEDVREDSVLEVPIGRIDDAHAHSQDLMAVDMSGAGGNVGIVGASQSGKSTAIQMLMMLLANSHSPQRVQFYCIDFGGGKLGRLTGLPHVSGVAGSGSDDKVRRVLAELERLLRFRKRSWEEAGLDLDEFRARKFGTKGGAVPEDHHGDVFLVVDNLAVLQVDFDTNERFMNLIESAMNYGIHIIASAESWNVMKSRTKNKFGTKIELRLSNPTESEMGDRMAAQRIPATQPGRAMAPGGKHMLLGVPAASSTALGTEQLGADVLGGEALEATVASIAQAWQRRGAMPAPTLQVLPAAIGFADLPAAAAGVLAVGLGESEMAAVGIDLNEAPHFCAVGAAGCGRSTFLKTAIAAIKATFSPQDAKILVFDVGMGLTEAYDPEYMLAYETELGAIKGYAEDPDKGLLAVARKRRPPKDLDRIAMMRWQTDEPRLFLIVDDLHLLNPAGGRPLLEPIAKPVLLAGRRLRIHMIATTTLGPSWYGMSSGAVFSALKDGGMGTLVMDGENEAIVPGVKAAPRPPGRGELLYRKGGRQLMQVALPPEELDAVGGLTGP